MLLFATNVFYKCAMEVCTFLYFKTSTGACKTYIDYIDFYLELLRVTKSHYQFSVCYGVTHSRDQTQAAGMWKGVLYKQRTRSLRTE